MNNETAFATWLKSNKGESARRFIENSVEAEKVLREQILANAFYDGAEWCAEYRKKVGQDMRDAG